MTAGTEVAAEVESVVGGKYCFLPTKDGSSLTTRSGCSATSGFEVVEEDMRENWYNKMVEGEELC